MKIRITDLDDFGNEDGTVIDTSNEDWRKGMGATDVSLIESALKYKEAIAMGHMVAEPLTQTAAGPRFK